MAEGEGRSNGGDGGKEGGGEILGVERRRSSGRGARIEESVRFEGR